MTNSPSVLVFSAVFVGIAIPLYSVSAFTVGVPPLRTVCATMTPMHHKYLPQDVETPYQVFVNRNEVTGGSTVDVTLTVLDPKKHFIGFYVQARDIEDQAIGTFVPNDLTKVHSCSGIRANAAHHASGEVFKKNVTITWIAPKKYQGEVQFAATILRDFVTYWVFHMSPPVTIKEAVEEPGQTPARSRPRPFQGFTGIHNNINNVIGRTINDVGTNINSFIQSIANGFLSRGGSFSTSTTSTLGK